ncbi:MAG: hypothetical protein AAFX76_10145 [Planctomycetota bacterium]
MVTPPRSAAEILADLQVLDRENDRLEHRLALVRQSLKAAESRSTASTEARSFLERAQSQLRDAG